MPKPVANPFEIDPSTATYVARRATDLVLDEIEEAICEEVSLVALVGPPGIGKTLMLRMVRRSFEARMWCVEVPREVRSLEEICAAAISELGQPTSQPVQELIRIGKESVGRELGRSGILLLVDAGESLSAKVVRQLRRLTREAPHVQVVIATQEEGAGAWLNALASEITRVDLRAPMTVPETLEYVRTRLDLLVAAPAVRRRLGWWTVLRLWRESRGNPKALHYAAARRLASVQAGDVPTSRVRWSRLLALLALLAMAVGVYFWYRAQPVPPDIWFAHDDAGGPWLPQTEDPALAAPRAEADPIAAPPATE